MAAATCLVASARDVGRLRPIQKSCSGVPGPDMYWACHCPEGNEQSLYLQLGEPSWFLKNRGDLDMLKVLDRRGRGAAFGLARHADGVTRQSVALPSLSPAGCGV